MTGIEALADGSEFSVKPENCIVVNPT